jgi:hypothetical protein
MKDLSLHILDIVQNSIRAGAKLVQITIQEKAGDNSYTICITDDGFGMTEEELLKVTDPYFTSRTTRKVGLGIPLLKQNAERTGGCVNIHSIKGEGTTVTAKFGLTHLDRPATGDIASTIVLLIAGTTNVEFEFTYQTDKGLYSLKSIEIKEILEGISLYEFEVQRQLNEMINSNLVEIGYSR